MERQYQRGRLVLRKAPQAKLEVVEARENLLTFLGRQQSSYRHWIGLSDMLTRGRPRDRWHCVGANEYAGSAVQQQPFTRTACR